MPAVKDSPLLNRLEAAAVRVEEIDRLLSQPARAGQQSEIQRLGKERSELASLSGLYQEFFAVLKEIADAEEMLEDPRGDMKDLAREELKELHSRKSEIEGRARDLLIVKDPRDQKNTFIEVRAGTGGEEAALFAAELVRMYTRYAEQRRWRVELIDSSMTELGGVREAVVLIEGKGVYSRFKHESGVHRVQRVPATEGSGRIHTSTVTVAVMPEAEEVEVQIDAKDLKIDTFCSSGAGGQSVNTTYSAVRITHIPTGIIVSCQDERSQLKNRNKAMRNLRSRIMDAEKEKQDSEIAQQRKSQVGTGDRSEKIRTYNFAQNRVTDHRIGLTLHRLDQVLQGDLDEIIDALIAANQMLGPD